VETESEVAEMSSWDQANRREKFGLVWRSRKKISQIINDFIYLPFFLLIILCIYISMMRGCRKPLMKRANCEAEASPGLLYSAGGTGLNMWRN
jgi:hypothetical protein